MALPLTSPSTPDAAPRAAEVHPIYARLLRGLLQDAGTDGDRVLAAAGLDPAALMADDRRLDASTVVQVVRAAIAATGRPWLGLDLGAQAPVSAHGSPGWAAVTAPDGRAALQALARFGPLRNDTFAWSFEARDDAGGAGVRFVERVPLGDARGFVLDATLSAALRVVEAAIGTRPAGLVIDLPFAPPPWQAEYARFGAASLRFDRPQLAIWLDAPALARRCLGADARAHAEAVRACEDALAERGGDRLAPRLRALIDASISRHAVDGGPGARPPTLGELAARHGLSTRTLMRHLHAEGTTYQDLLDDVRRTQARHLLEHTTLPMEEVAARLGYADTSNFSRTVKRWFARTPTEVRGRR